MSRMTVQVDGDRCISSGECEHLAPRTFAIDDDGVSTVVGVDEGDAELILRAASSCPARAIAVHRDGARREL